MVVAETAKTLQYLKTLKVLYSCKGVLGFLEPRRFEAGSSNEAKGVYFGVELSTITLFSGDIISYILQRMCVKQYILHISNSKVLSISRCIHNSLIHADKGITSDSFCKTGEQLIIYGHEECK